MLSPMTAAPPIPEPELASPRRRRIDSLAKLTIGLVALNLLWRFVRWSMAFPIWGDEAFVVINLMRRDFAGAVSPLEYGQIVPLGFMWLEMAITRVLGFSERALRLLPFVIGVVSMLVFWRFAVKTFGRSAGLLAVGIFAASYYPVRHATEVKPYASDLLASLVLTWLAWNVCRQPRVISRWLLLTGAAAFSIWLSYPAAFVVAGIGLLLTWIAFRQRHARCTALWLAYGLAVAVSFLIMFQVVAGPHASAGWVPGAGPTVDEWGRGFPLARGLAHLPLWFLKVHTGNMMAYPLGGRDGGSTVTFLLVLVGVVALLRARGDSPARLRCQTSSRELLVLLLSPLPFTFVAACMQRYPYGSSARFSLHVAPAICLLAGLGLATVLFKGVPRRHLRPALKIAASAFAVVILAGIARDIAKPFKTESDKQNREIVRRLAEQTKTSDIWISFNEPQAEPRWGDDIYLRGGNGARHRYYLLHFAPCPLYWAPPPSSIEPNPDGRIWLIAYRDNRAPFPEQRLDAYVAALTAMSGPPDVRRFALDAEREETVITVHRFGALP